MSSINVENAIVHNSVHSQFKFDQATIALSGAATILDGHATLLRIDPNGAARNVTLPATTRANKGRVFIIWNDADAAENLVVKQSDGSTTVKTIAQGGCGIFFNDGSGSTTTSWMGLLGA